QFDILRNWQQTELKSIKFLNAYGPTEATITSTLFDTPSDFCKQSKGKNVPIGKSIKGNKVLILDDHGNLLPEGVIGEIYIGGNTLSTGYLNRPDLTAEHFIPDPYSDIPGERLYKTGDLASYKNRDELEFYGRKDNQIKLRGIRIEIEEIESVIMQHPEISLAAVTVEESSNGEKNLVCNYIPESEQALDRFEIQEFLSERIPKYMIPSIFVALKELPVTSIGKIDRKSLPKSSISSDKLKTPYSPPRTSIEEKVSCIVADVLQLERVGIYDNFFELGGHSILAIQFVSKIKKEFGINMPLGCIFDNPDVASLSNEIVQIIANSFEEDNLEGLLTLVE
ncbi:MAG: AMP-binding protein, partial [Melioribacteraceae bacterium]|nr:AMP-binding protein [Melioribacteraceae bacterium]